MERFTRKLLKVVWRKVLIMLRMKLSGSSAYLTSQSAQPRQTSSP
ncbi:hypothetical protein CFP56_001672 [Quercus suber]|uniref:Uncharacterized protein n=1 Tax=Quercus suber TaxID=58331 RepID=A0AAW0LI78_QUESU